MKYNKFKKILIESDWKEENYSKKDEKNIKKIFYKRNNILYAVCTKIANKPKDVMFVEIYDKNYNLKSVIDIDTCSEFDMNFIRSME